MPVVVVLLVLKVIVLWKGLEEEGLDRDKMMISTDLGLTLKANSNVTH
jgi:hypothetical protein